MPPAPHPPPKPTAKSLTHLDRKVRREDIRRNAITSGKKRPTSTARHKSHLAATPKEPQYRHELDCPDHNRKSAPRAHMPTALTSRAVTTRCPTLRTLPNAAHTQNYCTAYEVYPHIRISHCVTPSPEHKNTHSNLTGDKPPRFRYKHHAET
jgi:hypothetical protein